ISKLLIYKYCLTYSLHTTEISYSTLARIERNECNGRGNFSHEQENLQWLKFNLISPQKSHLPQLLDRDISC
ncbi:hypothetical protein C2C27_19700, partial [Salmonella enterica subsp. houtenae serovar 48:g,z51:-]|nr:hypothetical protein [Salmonella enterica subsp. houtenae serovar 48:g,z51:-]